MSDRDLDTVLLVGCLLIIAGMALLLGAGGVILATGVCMLVLASMGWAKHQVSRLRTPPTNKDPT